MPPELSKQFIDALMWVAGAGGAYLASQIVSLLSENIPAWHKIPAYGKMAIQALLSVGLAVLAQWLLGFPALVENLSPWYTVIIAALAALVGNQKAYMDARRSYYGYAATSLLDELEDEAPV